MTTTQLEKEILQQSKGLPKEVLKEVIDFIQFLRQKKMMASANDIYKERSNLNFLENDHLEEEFKNYKQIYPNE